MTVVLDLDERSLAAVANTEASSTRRVYIHPSSRAFSLVHRQASAGHSEGKLEKLGRRKDSPGRWLSPLANGQHSFISGLPFLALFAEGGIRGRVGTAALVVAVGLPLAAA